MSYSCAHQRSLPKVLLAGVGAVGSKKSVSSSWLETDLDMQVTQDSPLRSPLQTSPLYVNTDVSKSAGEQTISRDPHFYLLASCCLV